MVKVWVHGEFRVEALESSPELNLKSKAQGGPGRLGCHGGANLPSVGVSGFRLLEGTQSGARPRLLRNKILLIKSRRR